MLQNTDTAEHISEKEEYCRYPLLFKGIQQQKSENKTPAYGKMYGNC